MCFVEKMKVNRHRGDLIGCSCQPRHTMYGDIGCSMSVTLTDHCVI